MTTLLGRFEIDSEIGRGAMGVVYRGRDPKIDRMVAIKTISMVEQDSDEEHEFRERFFQEAKAAGGLSHPGIVTVFDVGEEPESRTPYIVMEYVAGQPLNRILGASEKHKLPLGPALQLAQEIADALLYAHQRGVIHRDIKPANILVTREGHAKIADFGIAKVHQTQMTMPGRVLGSPAYMSPEQLGGAPADARSDLFSLGVILFTMVTGFKPFQGNSTATVISKVVHHDPVAVTIFEPNLPPALNRIVSRALAKDPAQRYQTAAELALDLQKLRESKKLLDQTADTLSIVTTPPVQRDSVVPLNPFPGKPRLGTRNSTQTGLVNSTVNFSRFISSRAALAAACVFVIALTFGLYARYHSKPMQPIAVAVPTAQVNSAKPETSHALTAPQIAHLESALPGNKAHVQPARMKPAPQESVLAANKAHVEPASIKSAPPEPARLEVVIQHPFVIGRASIWLDDNLVYQNELEGTTKRHALVMHSTLGLNTAMLKLPAGTHTLKVRVQSGADTYDMSKTVPANLASGRDSTLQIICNKQPNLLQVALQ